jgi:hypothetical protein
MGIDELNPHQKRVAKERAKQKTKFDYCQTCQRYRWMIYENNHWVCFECGCPVEEA